MLGVCWSHGSSFPERNHEHEHEHEHELGLGAGLLGRTSHSFRSRAARWGALG